MAEIFTITLTLTKAQKNTVRQALLTRTNEIRRAATMAAQRGEASEEARLTASAQEVNGIAALFR